MTQVSRFVISGARDSYPPRELAERVLNWAWELSDGACELVHGVATGVDVIVSGWAVDMGWTMHYKEAEWKMEGKGAGPLRNGRMLDGLCDCHPNDIVPPRMLLAFHDDLSRSKGTLDCIIQAGQKQVPVFYWGYERGKT